LHHFAGANLFGSSVSERNSLVAAGIAELARLSCFGEKTPVETYSHTL
jgi:hypothetical protein